MFVRYGVIGCATRYIYRCVFYGLHHQPTLSAEQREGNQTDVSCNVVFSASLLEYISLEQLQYWHSQVYYKIVRMIYTE